MAKKKASHRVHIACFDDGHIVPRMMSWLADGLGWSIGNYLDPDPDVTNYYGPYTMFGQYGRSAGKSTGWFTHMETSNLAKMEIWNRASKAIDLPLLTSPVYQPDLPKSALVTPGVDQNHFVPVNKKLPGKGIVGVVGVPQPRKGLELAKAILDLGVANNVRIVGGQWEGFEKSESIPYEQMPEFYAGIDLLVCTSLEEGIPASPFEALACGVPVVVPVGVGALDLLPDTFGIYRYEKGDSFNMNMAIKVALNEKHDRSELRDTVAPFTVQAWVDSHAVALEELLHE